jgi:restriction endonuclease S subunit
LTPNELSELYEEKYLKWYKTPNFRIYDTILLTYVKNTDIIFIGTLCRILRSENVTKKPVQKTVVIMTIENVATVRTGYVTTRKKKASDGRLYKYGLLNLKCIMPDGYIDTSFLEPFESTYELKEDYLTQPNDILIRLSYPYTVVLIKKWELYGLVIPSHFAVVRAKQNMVLPEYLYWYLKRDKSFATLLQNSSGSTSLGTISSGLIASLPIRVLSMKQQTALGNLLLLSEREQELMRKLAEYKKIYHQLLINQIYDNTKEGK